MKRAQNKEGFGVFNLPYPITVIANGKEIHRIEAPILEGSDAEDFNNYDKKSLSKEEQTDLEQARQFYQKKAHIHKRGAPSARSP